MSIELNRSAFEAFAQRNEFGTYRTDRKGDGYDSSHTQLMWMAWCAAIQQAEANTAPADPMLVTEIKPRPLSYSLHDYHYAGVPGSVLHAQWQDKPHRLLYDLIAAVAYYAGKQPATGEPVMDVRCEGCGYMTHHREHMGCVRAAKQHTHPAPSVPDPIDPPAEDGTEYDYCSGHAAGYAEGWNACRAAMLVAAKEAK